MLTPASLTDDHTTLSRRTSTGALRQVNEQDRLDALRSYQILDTPPEKVFDDLVRLASFICGTPISMVSLIDGERQWFKARLGMEAEETPRTMAFCEYAMRDTDVFEVADATEDPLFQENPLVTGDPHIRFYAGAPLLTPEGMPLGALCAIDTVPRQLSEEQREALRILARQVVAHLELRRIRLQLEDERQKLDGVLRMTNDAAEYLYAGGRTEIFVKQEQRLVRVLTQDIQYVEALGDYVNIYTNRERMTVYSTMKEMEAKLPTRDFIRIHRKYIVRLDRVMAIETDAVMLDAVRDNTRVTQTVPIGNSYKANLLNRINQV